GRGRPPAAPGAAASRPPLCGAAPRSAAVGGRPPSLRRPPSLPPSFASLRFSSASALPGAPTAAQGGAGNGGRRAGAGAGAGGECGCGGRRSPATIARQGWGLGACTGATRSEPSRLQHSLLLFPLSAMKVATKSIERELICPACKELFTHPLILPCQHNVCHKCVKEILFTLEDSFADGGSESSNQSSPRIRISSPSMDRIDRISRSGMYLNFALGLHMYTKNHKNFPSGCAGHVTV
uniref:Zinc finger RING-type eukaryotic domain-containing protein n=1 Tax=Anas platyrhynchos platyrhynchos TaxID=8840 RepID=A0A493T393_ANAPP